MHGWSKKRGSKRGVQKSTHACIWSEMILRTRVAVCPCLKAVQVTSLLPAISETTTKIADEQDQRRQATNLFCLWERISEGDPIVLFSLWVTSCHITSVVNETYRAERCTGDDVPSNPISVHLVDSEMDISCILTQIQPLGRSSDKLLAIVLLLLLSCLQFRFNIFFHFYVIGQQLSKLNFTFLTHINCANSRVCLILLAHYVTNLIDVSVSSYVIFCTRSIIHKYVLMSSNFSTDLPYVFWQIQMLFKLLS